MIINLNNKKYIIIPYIILWMSRLPALLVSKNCSLQITLLNKTRNVLFRLLWFFHRLLFEVSKILHVQLLRLRIEIIKEIFLKLYILFFILSVKIKVEFIIIESSCIFLWFLFISRILWLIEVKEALIII